MKQRKVAVVDRTPDIAGMYSDILSTDGVNVIYIPVTPPQDILDRIKRERPNLVLMTASFSPQGRTKEGLELLTQLQDVPVVIAHSGTKYKSDAELLGAKDYFEGIIPINEIRERILNALKSQS